jgi:PAS domain S-box-containing protein
MAPGQQIDDLTTLRFKLAEMEAELHHLRRDHNHTEQRYHELLDTAPVMIWISGPDAMCIFLNRGWLDYTGRPIEEELGNGWANGLHPDDRDLCLETYLKAFTARQPFRLECRLQRGSGDFGWIECRGTPRADEHGRFGGFVITASDISGKRRQVFTPDEESVRLVFALTERERQVLVLIAGGRSTKEAALQLGISYKTADSHRSRILEKLGVHETASMVRYAIRAGLIEA